MSYLSKVVVRDREEIKQMEGNSLLTEMGRKNLKLIADPRRVCWEIFRLSYPPYLEEIKLMRFLLYLVL